MPTRSGSYEQRAFEIWELLRNNPSGLEITDIMASLKADCSSRTTNRDLQKALAQGLIEVNKDDLGKKQSKRFVAACPDRGGAIELILGIGR